MQAWPKLVTAAPKYQKWLSKTNPNDLKKAHVFMNDAAQAELVEYYLTCALLFVPDEVKAIEKDSDKLLKLADHVANSIVEPILETGKNLALEYNETEHRALEDLTIWKEIQDDLYFYHSFENLAKKEFDSYNDVIENKLGRSSSKDYFTKIADAVAEAEAAEKIIQLPENIEIELNEIYNADSEIEKVTVDLFSKWVNIAGHPIRGTVRNALLDMKFLMGVDRAWEGRTYEEREAGKKHEKAKEVTLD